MVEHKGIKSIKKKKEIKKIRRLLMRNIIVFIIGSILISYLSINVIQVTKIQGASMEPGLQPGSYGVIYKQAYKYQEPERFDIVAFELIEGSDHCYIKRIIGLPGESVWITGGRVFVDGNAILDPVGEDVISEALIAKEPIILDEDEYFVLGDNRNESLDSRDRNFGNVKREYIIGKLIEW